MDFCFMSNLYCIAVLWTEIKIYFFLIAGRVQIFFQVSSSIIVMQLKKFIFSQTVKYRLSFFQVPCTIIALQPEMKIYFFVNGRVQTNFLQSKTRQQLQPETKPFIIIVENRVLIEFFPSYPVAAIFFDGVQFHIERYSSLVGKGTIHS